MRVFVEGLRSEQRRLWSCILLLNMPSAASRACAPRNTWSRIMRYICVCVFIYVYILMIYIYIYTHTHTHTCIIRVAVRGLVLGWDSLVSVAITLPAWRPAKWHLGSIPSGSMDFSISLASPPPHTHNVETDFGAHQFSYPPSAGDLRLGLKRLTIHQHSFRKLRMQWAIPPLLQTQRAKVQV